ARRAPRGVGSHRWILHLPAAACCRHVVDGGDCLRPHRPRAVRRVADRTERIVPPDGTPQGCEDPTWEPKVSEPVGMSHVAVVSPDLDGFRAFYEDTIGLETTIVFGAGPGHTRQAV